MLNMMNLYRFAALFFVVAIIASCSTSNVKEEEQVNRSADILYNQAAALIDQGKFKEATEKFNEVERQHPYSQWATRAQLMAAYGYYKEQDYDQAILTAERFIKLHPGHKDIDYAYYLKALNFYEQIVDVGRDQAMTELALENLDILIRRFPNSKYTRDATLKRDLTLDHLAGKEMEIGRYYLMRGHYNAAINRFKEVVRHYQTTTHTPEALHRMVEAYMALGIKPEATRVAAVLGYNYPGSAWYEDSYKILDDRQRERLVQGKGWLDRTVESIFGKSDDPAPQEDVVEAIEEAEKTGVAPTVSEVEAESLSAE